MNNDYLKTLVQNLFIAALLLPAAAQSADDEAEILYWVAPMDANYRRDKPGKSPMGMELVPVYANASGDSGDSGDSGKVIIAAEVIQNLGVRTATVERSALQRVQSIRLAMSSTTRPG